MQTGTNWGGQYSRFNFDEDKDYVAVLKEMKTPGTLTPVPLLDDELNENSEIMLTLMRRAVTRVFGDGTYNGFAVTQSAGNTSNNFTITGGDGTNEGAGYICVAGWQIYLKDNLEYTAQTGVSALTTPSSDRIDQVYVDCWYDEIGSSQDSDIEDPTVAMETSRRLKLKWLVKVAEGGSTPADYTDAGGLPHWTLHLATINRTGGSASITSSMIVDHRNDARKADAVFAKLDSIQNSSYVYAVDTGSANNYVVSLTPAPTAYANGMRVLFKAANANTGVSVLNVNGMGNVVLVRRDGSNLNAGDIPANTIIEVIYNSNGPRFEVQNAYQTSVSNLQSQVTSLSSTVSSHTSTLSSHASTISSHTSSISTNTSNISSLSSRTSTAESNIASHTNSISTINTILNRFNTHSIAGPGYQKIACPDGVDLLIQWGGGGVGAPDVIFKQVFPIAFPNNVFAVILQAFYGDHTAFATLIDTPTLHLTLNWFWYTIHYTTGGNCTLHWVAIGY